MIRGMRQGLFIEYFLLKHLINKEIASGFLRINPVSVKKYASEKKAISSPRHTISMGVVITVPIAIVWGRRGPLICRKFYLIIMVSLYK